MSSTRPAAAAFSEMRPSCGLRRSAMSSLAKHLEPRRDARAQLRGDPLRDAQHAVDAEADDERAFLGLEVDVAGALLGGLEDDRVDEPDERRVRDPVVDLEVVDFFVLRCFRDCVLDEDGVERFRGAGDASNLGQYVGLGGHVELDRVLRG